MDLSPPVTPTPSSPSAVQSHHTTPSPAASGPNTTFLVVGTAVGAVVGVVALLVVCWFFFYKKKSRRRETSRDNGPGGVICSARIDERPIYPPITPIPVQPVIGGTHTYEDLSVATSGFSESKLLGQGGSGLVYKGTLDGQEVAIKKLRSGNGQGDKEFRAEIEIISRVWHPNLVSLVGFCIHDEQRLLIYKYAPNKTLEFHLHGSGRPTLDWVRRWKIALGAAKGLSYLHHDCDPKVIHCNITAANILLDYDFEPIVSGFKLAKLMPGDITRISSSTIIGTFGYLAPEYVQSGKLTEKSDVYSYGVMLLELITGKRPVLRGDAYIDSLVDWARPLLIRWESEDVYNELVDPRLETNYDQHDMNRLIQCAHASVRNTALKRPRLSQIVRYLEGEISLVGPQRVVEQSGDVLRRMAFGGVISEDSESERSSEYTHTQLSSSHTDIAEIEMRPLNQQS